MLLAFVITLIGVTPVRADELDDYNVAVGLYKQSRWKAAGDEFRKFLRAHDKHEKAPLARLYLGLTLVNLENYSAARDELRKFADENRQNPNLAQARYRIGECSYLMDDFASAKTELESFVQDFPKDAMCEHALPYLGDTLLRSKDPAGALKAFDKAIDAYPQGKLIDDAKFGRARALDALKRPEDAARQYQELAATKDGTRAIDAQFHLSAGYFERKQFPEAIAGYSALIKDFPQSSLVPAAQLNLGYALYQSGKFVDAARQFELASKDKAQSLTALYWQGRSFKSMADYPKALEVLKAASKSAENQPLAEAITFEQALCERYLQHPGEARKLFEHVRTKFPKGDLADDSLHALIEMTIDASELADAESLIAEFKKDYPNSGLRLHIEMLTGRLELAKASLKRRDKQPIAEINQLYDAAGKRFDSVMNESSLPRTKAQARYYLALTRQLQDKPELVLDLIAPLVEAAKTDGAKSEFADAIVLQADALLQQKNYAAAGDAATRYIELNPKGRQVARALSIQALAAESKKDSATMNVAVNRLIDEFGTHPHTIATLQQLAEFGEIAEDWRGAGKLYESLAKLQKDPEQKAYAIRGIALSQYWQKQYPMAAETFGKIASDFPNLPLVTECRYYQAESLKKADQNDQSIAIFQKIFDSYQPSEPPAAGAELKPPLEFPYKAGLQVALGLVKANKVVEADAAYAALLKKFPNPMELDQRLDEWAILNYQSQRYVQADAIWRRLVQETPNSPLVNSAKLSLAESDLIANKLESARTTFEELAASDKSSNDVKEQSLYQLVVLAVDQLRWQDARDIGNKLTTQFPESAHRFYIAYTQAEAYLTSPKLSDEEQATIRDILKSLQARADNEEVNKTEWFDRVWVLLAELNFREKKYADVSTVVEDLRQRRPKSPLLHQADEVLGRSLKQQAPPKFDDARAAFERVIANSFAGRTETAAKAQFLIGETYFLQEKWSDASSAYQRVYSLYKFPEWQASALLMSAKCDEAQNDWKPAVETYKLLVKEFPNSSVTDEAKVRLEMAQKRVGG